MSLQKYFRILLVLSIPLLGASCRSVSTNPGNKDTSHVDTTHVDTTHIDTTAVKTGTIDGLVLKGPISPLQRQGESNEAPLANAPLTIANTGTYDAPLHLTSDVNGHFSAMVHPGTYAITPNAFPGQPLPRPMQPSTVTVRANTIVFDTLHYDTGIR